MLDETQPEREAAIERLKQVGTPLLRDLIAAVEVGWRAMEGGYQRCADRESCKMFVIYAKEIEYRLISAAEKLNT